MLCRIAQRPVNRIDEQLPMALLVSVAAPKPELNVLR